MDEPTASLTQKEDELLFAVVRDPPANGLGASYISHRLEEVFQLADRVTMLRDGESVGTRAVGARICDSQDQPTPRKPPESLEPKSDPTAAARCAAPRN